MIFACLTLPVRLDRTKQWLLIVDFLTDAVSKQCIAYYYMTDSDFAEDSYLIIYYGERQFLV